MAGATLTLVDDATGAPLPRDKLGPDQQGQKTPLSGQYQFDPPAGTYRVIVAADPDAFAFPSQKRPPLGESATAPFGAFATDGPNGLVSADAKPSTTQASYYLRFQTNGTRGAFGNNLIPLDPTTGLLKIAAVALTPHITSGDAAAMQITIDNGTTNTFANPPLALQLQLAGAFVPHASTLDVIDRASGKVVAVVGVSASGQLTPFSIAAGGKYALSVPLASRANQKVGHYNIGAILAGGVFSAKATATITVDADPIFDRSEILGRVFCDDNGDGRFDGDERGLPFVQIFMDTGAYAVSDVYGKFHFSNVPPGVHLAKVDVNTVPPGSESTNGIRRDFHLTDGLPAKIDFGFQCAIERSAVPNDAAPKATPGAKSLTVTGSDEPLALSCKPPLPLSEASGRKPPLPLSEASGRKPPLPLAGEGGGEGTLDIVAVLGDAPPDFSQRSTELARSTDGSLGALHFATETSGDLPRRYAVIVRDAERHVLFRFDGQGAVPAIIPADFSHRGKALLAEGRAYTYELVAYDEARLVRSAQKALIIVPGENTRILVEAHGPSFIGDTVSPAFAARLKEVKFPATGAVIVEVHTADDAEKGTRLLLSQRRAEAVKKLLVTLGVTAARINAIGRGDLDPLVPNLGNKGREQNRRVIIRIPGPVAAAPASAPVGLPMATVQGQVLPLDDHHFAVPVLADLPRTAFVQNADGQALGLRTPPPVAEQSAGLVVSGTLSSDAIYKEGAPLPVPLANFACAFDGPRPALLDGSKLLSPLAFVVAGEPDELSIAIADRDGNPLESQVVTARDGRATFSPTLALSAGYFQVRCTGKNTAGDSVTTPPELVAVVSGQVREQIVRGELFKRGPQGPVVGADLQRVLAAVAKEGAAFEIEVHGPGSGSAASEDSQTGNEAEAAATFLTKQGAKSVSARGLGRRQLLLPTTGKKAFDKNRRVVLRIHTPGELSTDVPVFAPVQPHVMVNGSAASVDAHGAFKVWVAAADNLIVEMLTTQGRSAVFRLGQAFAEDTWRLPFAGEEGPEAEFIAPPILPIIAAAGAPAAATLSGVKLELPPDGVTFKNDKVFVRAFAPIGSQVRVGSLSAVVDKSGEADLLVPLKDGENVLAFAVKSELGEQGTLVRHWVFKPNRWFLLALGEGSAGQSGAQAMLPETTSESTIQVLNGDAFLHGRGVLYFKGEFKGDWFFKDTKVTAYFDSAGQQNAVFARNVIDPDHFYPVYGDSGSEVQDASTQYKMYVLVEADDSKLQGGSIKTNMHGLELLRYDRALFGARLEFNRSFSKYDKTQLTAFGGEPIEATRRVHLALRGTGGSLYMMRDRDLAEGTEVIRLVVRDVVSGTVVQEVPKQRNVDYTIDYDTGRVVFLEPVPSVAQGSLMTSGLMPLSVAQGDPVFVEVDYEARDGGAAGQYAGGAYLKETLFNRVTVGGGMVDEHRSGSADYRVYGGSLEVKPIDGVSVSGELNRSESQDAAPSVSTDGGLSYADTNRPATSASTGTIQPVTGYAMKATAAIDLQKILHSDRQFLTFSGYAARIDPNYYSGDTTLEQGQVKFGAAAKGSITDKDFIIARHDGVFADIGDNAQPQFSDRRVERELTSGGYEHKEDRWSVGALYFHSFTADSEAPHSVLTDTVDLRADYKITQKWTVFATQEFVLRGDPTIITNTGDHFATQLGTRYKFTDQLEGQISEIVRYGGSNATEVGFRSPMGGDGRVYVNERFSRDLGGWNATTIVGGENTIARGSKAYGEYQLGGGISGEQARAVFGLNNRWELLPGLYGSILYEHSQNLGAQLPAVTGAASSNAGFPTTQQNFFGGQDSGMLARDRAFFAPSAILGLTDPVGIASRDAASAGLEFVRLAFFKISGKFEIRYDNQDQLLNQRDRVLLYGTLGSSYQLSPELSVVGKLEWANAREPGHNYTIAEMGQGSIGLAYRPIHSDYFHARVKYTKRDYLQPRDLGPLYKEDDDAVAIVPVVELPWIRTQLVEKGALKLQRLVQATLAPQSTDILLWINRVNVHILKWLDAGVEYRIRADTAANQAEGGFLTEVSVLPWEYVRLGVGYNFTHFSDDELADPRIDNKGFFVRAIGRY